MIHHSMLAVRMSETAWDYCRCTCPLLFAPMRPPETGSVRASLNGTEANRSDRRIMLRVEIDKREILAAAIDVFDA
jgi:hypothetical protein